MKERYYVYGNHFFEINEGGLHEKYGCSILIMAMIV